MADSDNGQTRETAAREEEISSAKEIVQAVVKAARGLTIYPPGSPFHERFLGELQRKLTAHAEGYGPLRFELEHYEMRVEGEVVYENRNPKDSLAFRLHADGIKSLEFREGVTEEETGAFLRIINIRSSDLEDDDILTLLWSSDFQHIGYTPEDDLDPADLLASPSGGAERQRTGIRQACRAELEPSMTTPLMREEAASIFSLTEDERGFLEKAIRYEEERNPLEDMVELMPAILSSAEDETLTMEFLDLMGGIAGRLVAEGKVDQALFLLRILRDHVRERGKSEAVRGKAAAVLEGIGSVPEMQSPEGLLRSAASLEGPVLGETITLLGKGAIRPFALLLGEELGETAEKDVVETLAMVGRSSPQEFFPFLSADNPRRARNILQVLLKAGAAAEAETLGELIRFGDAPLRKEVLFYLDSLGVPGTADLLLQMLGDESGPLRVNAARSLARRKERSALEGLIALVDSDEFRERGPAERKILFETIGKVGGEEAVPFLRKKVLTRRTFARKREKEEVACAVAGLTAVGTRVAMDVLNSALDSHKGESREIVARALAGLQGKLLKGGKAE
jgi:HEAT repeat protein